MQKIIRVDWEFVCMRVEVGSIGNPNFIEVRHGKMLINVPRRIFKGRTSALVPAEVEKFKKNLSSRYPWLSENAISVILEESTKTMEALLEMERSAVERGRQFLKTGEYTKALKVIERHIQCSPKDPDAWYLKGEILLKLGEREKGYQAFAKARRFSGASRQ